MSIERQSLSEAEAVFVRGPDRRPRATARVRRWTLGVAAGALATSALAAPAVADETDGRSTRAGVAVEAAPGKGGAGAEDSTVGQWRVESAGTDQWRLTWQGEEPLPLTSDRPVLVRTGDNSGALVSQASGSGDQVEVGTLSADRTEVSATVTQTAAPDVSQWDVRLSGVTLDDTSATGLAATPSGKVPTGRRLLAQDPAPAGGARVVVSDYDDAPVSWPGYPKPLEMVGHVVEPARVAQAAPRPVVLFLHGRHEVCHRGKRVVDEWPCVAPVREIGSHLGYDYLQRRLASQGYYTVSVRANGINAQDGAEMDGGAGARAMLVTRHLQRLASRASELNLDMSRVVLIGHSRGGEGVNRVALSTPLQANYRVVGQVLLAPTDFGGQSAPYVNTVAVLPSCDGDVAGLEGQQYVDVSRDLVRDDTSLKSALMMVGGNHNYFNTEWTPGLAKAPARDDVMADAGQSCGVKDPNRITAAQQRAAALTVVTGAVRMFASDQEQFAPLFDGSDVRVASAGTVALRSHTLGRGRSVVRVGELTVGAASGSGRVQRCHGVTVAEVPGTLPVCGHAGVVMPHWYDSATLTPRAKDALRFDWTKAGARLPLTFGGARNLSGRRVALRVAVDPTRKQRTVGLKLALTDTSGRTAVLTPTDGATLWAIPGGGTGERGVQWGQTVMVDPAEAAGAVNLGAIRAVALVTTSGSGTLHVLDLATVPTVVPAVPLKRAPLVSVGQVTQREGNGHQPVVVRIPLRVSGQLTEPARLAIEGPQTRALFGGPWVTLRPGQQVLEIPLRYQPDRAFGEDREFQINLMPDSGAMTNVWSGGLTVREDDPRPRVRVRADRAVREGQVLKVRITLSGITQRSVPVYVGFGKVKGRQLQARDLGLARFEQPGKPHQTLAASGAFRNLRIKRGTRSVVLRLPVRRDAESEPAEKGRLVVEVLFVDGSMVRRNVVFTVRD